MTKLDILKNWDTKLNQKFKLGY